MRKEIKIGSSTFAIEVILNTRIERRINGKRWHTIKSHEILSEDTDHELYENAEIEDSLLIDYIKEIEQRFKDHIANRNKFRQYDERLANLGFLM